MTALEPQLKPGRVYAPDPLGWYVEELRATEALLDVERFIGPVWDPACGQGNVIRACEARGVQSAGSDVQRRIPDDLGHVFAGEFDFLTADARPPAVLPFPAWHATNIVTNPPFFRGRGTEAFIRRALAVAVGKVAVWADLSVIAGDRRARGLWTDHPPTRVWSVSPRVSCPPGEFLAAGGKAENGTADWCWLVWDLTTTLRAPPALGWVRRE